MKAILLFSVLIFTTAAFSQNPVGSWLISGSAPDGQSFQTKVTFKADNTYDVDLGNDGSVDIKGKYSVDGGQITVWNVEGADCTAKGIYKFEVESDKLWMDPVSDDCPDRKPPQKVAMTKV